ncbi:MFS transporter [Auraticoccus monumenti]|uniref:Cyanate permease n=1 Tax=Auraticoccus monumenti TaxID=675864 RepID=A0A1G6ZNM4_9ACTN|nr:MFS transporter [Auraticoccus monumenti]SDE04092.1 Cyanate permease [Auraticoccus monumenti]
MTAGPRRALVALCLTQLTSWGVLYYAFPVLSVAISTDTGWSPSVLTAAFSAALVVSAVVGVPVGRWLDRHGPRALMTLGSVLASVAVVAVALAPTAGAFAAGWLVAGVAMSGVLYPPAFAALTRWYTEDRVRALTVLTLAGGLASTVFAPLTAALAGQLGWRGTYLALAAVLAAVTVPAHLWGLRLPWPPTGPAEQAQVGARTASSGPFLRLTAALALASCASYAVVVNLVPLLAERGIGVGVAALALGLGGLGQVAGRLLYPPLQHRLGVRTRTVLVLGLVALTTSALAAATTLVLVLVGAVLAGVVRGVMTLLQATAVPDRWGAAEYGRLSAVMAAPVTLAAALAPWIGAVVAGQVGGYAAMFATMAAVAGAAALLAWFSTPRLPASLGAAPRMVA